MARNDCRSNTGRTVANFKFSVGRVGRRKSKVNPKIGDKARKKVAQMYIDDLLEGTLSRVLLDTMMDRGFVHIGDIWPDSNDVRRLVPSYGEIKDQNVQEVIDEWFKQEKKKMQRRKKKIRKE